VFRSRVRMGMLRLNTSLMRSLRIVSGNEVLIRMVGTPRSSRDMHGYLYVCDANMNERSMKISRSIRQPTF
jgi:hypothetical protein